VEYQDREAERIYEETGGMTLAEELAYWRKKSGKVRKNSQRITRKSISTSSNDRNASYPPVRG